VDLTTGQQCVRAGAQANGVASFISKVPASSRMERDVFIELSRIEQQIMPSRYILIVRKKRLSGRIQYK
jgi:hypothetical protein